MLRTNANPKVLYIAGSGRSGSTLLERVLGQINGFTSIGELRHLWYLTRNDLCGCGNPLEKCPFWTNVFTRSFDGIENVDFLAIRKLRHQVDRIRYVPKMLIPRLSSKNYKHKFYHYSDIITDIYQSIQDLTACDFIVDSSKDISSLYMLSTLPDIDLYILHLVRDSRGVAYSWHRRKKLRPEITSRTTFMATHNPIKISGNWLYRHFLIELAQKRASQYLFVRYEDFIENPRVVIGNLLCDLSMPNHNLDFLRNEEVTLSLPNHTVAGNPIRFQSGVVPLKLDTEWKEKMTQLNKSIVTCITFPYLRKYKY